MLSINLPPVIMVALISSKKNVQKFGRVLQCHSTTLTWKPCLILLFCPPTVMWRALCRTTQRQSGHVCRTLIPAHFRHAYSLERLGQNKTTVTSLSSSSSIASRLHRWSSSSVTVQSEPFLSGSSGTYVEAMYESWQRDRNSVHKVRTVLANSDDLLMLIHGKSVR